MSKILDLKTRIEKLPQLQKQKLNNDRVMSYTEKLKDAFREVMSSVKRRNCFLVVFPKTKLKKTTDAVKQSKRQATGLIEKLKDDFDQIGTADTDKKITRIGERNHDASDQLRKEWKKQLLGELEPLIPLVEIVKEVQLLGVDEIVEAMEEVASKEETPPESMETARQIKDGLTLLRQRLSELDLEGPGGEFLKNAVNGRAKAKDLLKKEIQEFLDEKNLWDIFKINVG
ncbi:MAG: hypothetical protein CMJ82_05245 [Planctomycetaceae bacterium]|nr:hypothetical protein [Planctomycetaceae bacterium]|tara:strand:- start:251 stop:937 length:687 start_codon:yes stop_codon:yes gene_type:complete